MGVNDTVMDIQVIWFVAIVNAMLAFKLAWDWYAKNKQKRIINHTRSALIDGAIYVGSVWLLGLPWAWVVIAVAYRWIMFDLLFNLLNGWRWNFCGNSSKIDFTLDNLDGIDDNICKLGVLAKLLLVGLGILLL